MGFVVDPVATTISGPIGYGNRSMTNDVRPPCWPAGTQCPNDCAAALHDRVTRNHVALSGPWAGWRLAGRDLVAPDGQRINPQRLTGLMWRDAQELRAAGYANRRAAESGKKRFGVSSVKVVIVRLADWHARRFGRAA